MVRVELCSGESAAKSLYENHEDCREAAAGEWGAMQPTGTFGAGHSRVGLGAERARQETSQLFWY